jgi:hypothetical protein
MAALSGEAPARLCSDTTSGGGRILRQVFHVEKNLQCKYTSASFLSQYKHASASLLFHVQYKNRSNVKKNKIISRISSRY